MVPGISTIELLADRFLAHPEDEALFGRYQQACLNWAKENGFTNLESALAVAFEEGASRKELVWLTLGMVRGAISAIPIGQNQTDRSVFAAVVAAVISAAAILGASLLTNWDKITGKSSVPAKVPEVRIVMPTPPPAAPARVVVPAPVRQPQSTPSQAQRAVAPSAVPTPPAQPSLQAPAQAPASAAPTDEP